MTGGASACIQWCPMIANKRLAIAFLFPFIARSVEPPFSINRRGRTMRSRRLSRAPIAFPLAIGEPSAKPGTIRFYRNVFPPCTHVFRSPMIDSLFRRLTSAENVRRDRIIRDKWNGSDNAFGRFFLVAESRATNRAN